MSQIPGFLPLSLSLSTLYFCHNVSKSYGCEHFLTVASHSLRDAELRDDAIGLRVCVYVCERPAVCADILPKQKQMLWMLFKS